MDLYRGAQKMNSKETLKKQFGKSGEGISGWAYNQSPILEGKAVKLMPLRKDSRVIELGCGTGWASRRIARTAIEGEVVGIDFSESLINRAKQYVSRDKLHNYENLSFNVADAEDIPYPNNYFDSAITISSFSWWLNPEKGLEEIERVLKPGGQLYVVDCCKDRIMDNLFLRGEMPFSVYKENLYSKEKYREFFEKKFENVYQKNFTRLWGLVTVGTKKEETP